MKDPKCNFCNIEEECVIDESEYSRAYIFTTCLKLGHFVVAPKDHIMSFTQLSLPQLYDMVNLAKKVSKRILTITKAEKIYIAAIGDSGNHFHIHFMPKMKEETPLGTFIFSDIGWKGTLSGVSKEQLRSFAKEYKEIERSDEKSV